MRILIFLFLWCAAADATESLDPLLARSDLWSLKQDDFAKLPEARRFRWTSQTMDSARAANGYQLYGVPVIESVARFDGGKLSQITAILYARGDAGELSKEAFEALLKTSAEALNTATAVKPVLRGKDASNAVHAEGVIWQTPAVRYLMEYSFTREVKTRNIPYRAEFIRLEITPPEKPAALLATGTSENAKAKFSGAAHVKRDVVSGDVVITDVPMVDQGQKGYCAVACTERVMRYYGIPADENEIAQVANTSSGGGTSADAMFDALKKLGARLRVRVRPVEQMDIRQIMVLMAEYNRTAKHEHAPLLPDQGHMIDVSAMFHAMQPDVLKETRTKNKAEQTKFDHEVQTHVDAGIPVVWSVVLGIMPEKEIPQAFGGHMRLIIGYNSKTQEVLYTDSWGAGHELKRMPEANALTMTTGLTVIEPMSM